MRSLSVIEYLTLDGHSPFSEWLLGLRDMKARARIRARLDRVGLGNLGDYQLIGGGIFELRFFFGPGYRVYYGLEDGTKLVLLVGGIKDNQRRDIGIAKGYWQDYRVRNNGNQ